MGSMLGIVLSGNLIQLVFFWELTSLFSFLLIGYWHHRARCAARRAHGADRHRRRRAVPARAACCCSATSSAATISTSVLGAGDAIRAHDALSCRCSYWCCWARSPRARSFPFHFWLPHAMAAPTPVSAYLHSATMVKAGVFLLARLWPVLAGTEPWFWIVGGAGFARSCSAPYAAMFQHDLKGLLAYSTISHLGLITLLLGLNSPLAAVAAVFHMMNHATFKASLFMAAGVIDHETGTRDLVAAARPVARRCRSPARSRWSPARRWRACRCSTASCRRRCSSPRRSSSRRCPWSNGACRWPRRSRACSRSYTRCASAYGVFFGPPSTDLPREPHEPVALDARADRAAGARLPGRRHRSRRDRSGRRSTPPRDPSSAEPMPDYGLALWHGFNAPLVMSLIAMAGGVVGLCRVAQSAGARRFRRPPLVPAPRRQAAVRVAAGALDLRSPAALLEFFGTRRLQPQIVR